MLKNLLNKEIIFMREQSARKLVYIEDEDIVRIMFRNFAGNPDKYHKNGVMPNFWIVLTEEKAKELINMGMNVKERENRDGDLEYRLQVFVRFDNFPPTVVKICGRRQIRLDEDMIADLDRDEIEKIDLAISPYHYEMEGRTGIKAYLNKGYFTIIEDEFDRRYNFDDEETFGEE